MFAVLEYCCIMADLCDHDTYTAGTAKHMNVNIVICCVNEIKDGGLTVQMCNIGGTFILVIDLFCVDACGQDIMAHDLISLHYCPFILYVQKSVPCATFTRFVTNANYGLIKM